MCPKCLVHGLEEMRMFSLTNVLVIALIIVAVVIGTKLARSMLSINAKLELLLRHFSISMNSLTLQEELDAALDAGDTVRAVKLYREVMGVGLAEAKRAVEERGALRSAKRDQTND